VVYNLGQVSFPPIYWTGGYDGASQKSGGAMKSQRRQLAIVATSVTSASRAGRIPETVPQVWRRMPSGDRGHD